MRNRITHNNRTYQNKSDFSIPKMCVRSYKNITYPMYSLMTM